MLFLKSKLLSFALFTLLISCIGFADHASDSVYSWKIKNVVHSEELENLDNQIQTLQKALENSVGFQQLYICGGSARSILDHIYLNKPLKMRDLDIVILAKRELQGEDVRLLAQSLEQLKVGTFDTSTFNRRPRHPHKIPFQQDTEYNAGFGFYLLTSTGLIIDLTVFENESDLALNGLLDIDTVKIVLQKGESLTHFFENANGSTFGELISNGKVIDQHQGYEHWIKKDPIVVHWHRIEVDPQFLLFRLIRDYAKMDALDLSKNLWRKLHNLCVSHKTGPSRDISQHLLKVLNDESAHQELKLLQELGAFQYWLPEFSKWLEKKDSHDLALILDNNLISPTQKFMLLVQQLPKDHQLETWFRGMYKLDLAAAIERSFELIPEAPTVDKKSLKSCMEQFSRQQREELEIQLQRIISSKALSHDERFDLIIRALVRCQKDSTNIVKTLIPDIGNESLKSLLAKIKGKRKGFLTGVFDPYQHGHTAIITAAVEQLVLDEILLIPIEVDPSRTTAPWADRVDMINIATQHIPEVRLPLQHHHELIKENTETFKNDDLKNLQPEDQFWHVMGSDAFERYSKYGLLKNEIYPLFIFYRPDYPLSIEIKDYPRQIIYFDLKEKAVDFSCNEVRSLTKAQKPIKNLVPEGVSDYIEKKQLYAFRGSLARPFYIMDKDETLYKAVKHYFPTIRQAANELPRFDGEDIQSIVEKRLEFSLKTGVENLIGIEFSIEIEGWEGFPGTMTSAWMKKTPPDLFKNMIKEGSLQKARLDVVLGYLGTDGQKIYISLNKDCDLQALIKVPGFQWQDLFYKPLPGRELSLVDLALARLVRDLLFQERVEDIK